MNMSYCRFENTQLALQDCFNHINDKDLSPTEKLNRQYLIDICRNIVDITKEDDFEEEV